MSPGGDGDDERTVIRPPSRRADVQLGHTLPVGTRLRDYEINGLIGEGGFGIVYLAWDHSLQRKVAVKEYMPASMASRVNGSSAIVVKSDRHVDTFRAGLKSFVNEARLLARFDHPSLVKVYRFWEENGTAYMVMPFYEGPTLKTALAELGRAPSEAELRVWLRPLLDALTVMHAAQCFHRDIAPDNILLTPTGPLLLDFGAARRVIGDMTHALTVVLKPGYAPIEQYGDVATMAQGAWTDIYALACVVYYAITGKTPTSSVERLMDDRLEPLAVAAAGRYSPAFLGAIDHALAVRPQDRPQTERQFRDLLDADLPVEVAPTLPAASVAVALQPSQPFARTEGEGYSTVPGTITPVLATQLLQRATELHLRPLATVPPAPAPAPVTPIDDDRHAGAPSLPYDAPLSDTAPFAATDAPVLSLPAAKPRPSAVWWIAVAVLLLGGVLAAYVWTLSGARSSAPATSPADASASLPAAAAPITPQASSTAAVLAPVPAPSVVAPTPAASAVEPGPTPAAPTFAPPVATAPTLEAPIATPPPTILREAAKPTPVPATPRPRSEPAARTEPPYRSEPATVPRRAGGARCSDILQKGSLEPLSAEEAAYLKRECR